MTDIWYEITEGNSRYATDDWDTIIDAVTGWYEFLADEEPDIEQPNPSEMYGIEPDVERMNALIAAWQVDLSKAYPEYIFDQLRVRQVSYVDAHSVPLKRGGSD
jgi:hypothetical protein